MMWLLIVANIATGELHRYELPDRATCTRAVALIERDGGMSKAWCIPSYRLITVMGAA